MPAQRHVMDCGVDIRREEQQQRDRSRPSRQSPRPMKKKARGYGKFQNTRQINDRRPPGNPSRQHLRHRLGLNKVPDAGEYKQKRKTQGSSTKVIELAIRRCRPDMARRVRPDHQCEHEEDGRHTPGSCRV